MIRLETGSKPSTDANQELFQSVRGSLRRLRPLRHTYQDRIHVPCDDENRIRLYQGHPQKDAPTALIATIRNKGEVVVDITDFRRPGSGASFQLLTPAFPKPHSPLPDTRTYDGFRVTFSSMHPPFLEGIVGVDLVPLPDAIQGHHDEFAASVDFGLSVHAARYGWSFFDNV